jgi:hypothetical protein
VAGPHVATAVPVTVVNVGATVTPFAASPPAGAVFWASAVSVTCPALTGEGGWARKATESPAAARTVVAGDVVAAAASGAKVPDAVPPALAVKVSVPAPETVQVNA